MYSTPKRLWIITGWHGITYKNTNQSNIYQVYQQCTNCTCELCTNCMCELCTKCTNKLCTNVCMYELCTDCAYGFVQIVRMNCAQIVRMDLYKFMYERCEKLYILAVHKLYLRIVYKVLVEFVNIFGHTAGIINKITLATRPSYGYKARRIELTNLHSYKRSHYNMFLTQSLLSLNQAPQLYSTQNPHLPWYPAIATIKEKLCMYAAMFSRSHTHTHTHTHTMYLLVL
jgi:hypothetical protein